MTDDIMTKLFLYVATAPNVTVTVMLSGNLVEHQLKGLQRGTQYIVKVLSQKDSLQSMAIATTFTTANGEWKGKKHHQILK